MKSLWIVVLLLACAWPARAEEYTRTYWTGGTLFEELGFYYVGPIDGHDLNVLLPVLRNVRDSARPPWSFSVIMPPPPRMPPCHALPPEPPAAAPARAWSAR